MKAEGEAPSERLPSPLTQRREVHHGAAHEDARDLEGALARGESRRDVRIARELVGGLAGGPVEDLKVPGAAGVADSVGMKLRTLHAVASPGSAVSSRARWIAGVPPDASTTWKTTFPFASCCAACGDEVTLAVASYSMIWLS